ncbi:MAG TPA: HAD family phosphatase [Chitinophagaceae bacterium]|nr:HAD family phosphatase [Chitinophagaceae bacterium]
MLPLQNPVPKAFLFDLNGTLINDMEFHIQAWHTLLNNELGATLNWAEVKREMYGKNSELLVRVFGAGHFSDAEMEQWSVEKERRYQQEFAPHLKTIDGLDAFLKTAADAGIRMAIGSAAIPMNVDFVLDGLHLRPYFDAVVTAADVTHSKPNPETFVKAARQLHIAPADCVVFEDAPKGVEAALNAGMKAVVLTTMHGEEAFARYPNIVAFVRDYTDPVLQQLFLQIPV